MQGPGSPGYSECRVRGAPEIVNQGWGEGIYKSRVRESGYRGKRGSGDQKISE
ncbi:unnamed protein product [Staurois parvus]|uniref:Uncharacterized protein n=1 Tax=Staurois parvus TaxID=386267 RepID=A0ABN9DIZ6_9NEOB|nr:unnamed protein product [Staurois parvus]